VIFLDSRYVIFTVGVWLLFMVIAIINAGIRNGVYKPIVGDLAAHQISSIIFIVAIFLVTYFALRFSNLALTDTQSLYIGIVWLIFTILFEFVAGHYVFGNPWENLIKDYNLLEGRIWSLVLLTIVLSPYITNRLQ
jgi:hypothetical protein